MGLYRDLCWNSGQRWPSESSKGLDYLLRPGLGKEGHLREALLLPSPSVTKAWPDDDIAFVVESIRIWGPDLPVLAQRQRRLLKSIRSAVAPLQAVLGLQRSESAKRVAGSKKAAFIVCMTALLRWPDTTQAAMFVQGFPSVGQLESSAVFRACNQCKPEAQSEVGRSACS